MRSHRSRTMFVLGLALALFALFHFVISPTSAALDEPRGDRPVLIRDAALVLTMDPGLGTGPLGILEGGDVLFDRTRILAVGQGLDAQGAEVLDGTGRIVMPGFVDLHNHLHQSGIRGCRTDLDLIGWLATCSRTLNNLGLSRSESYTLARLSTLGVISTGVTTVVDWVGPFSRESAEGQLSALTDSGLRFAFAYRAARTGGAEEIRRLKRELIDPNPLASLQVAALPSLQEELNGAAQVARELGLILHVHLLENIAQRQERQVEALMSANALGPNLLVAHAIHLTDEEIAVLATNDVRVAHNPLSNMRLASGIIRFPELPNAGLKIGLGLDGGTNDTADMFNDMRAAVGLQRAKHLNAGAYPTVTDVLRLATLGGAEALGMNDRIGSLTPGKQADLIVFDPRGINFAPRIDWVSQIVFNGRPDNVEWVFVSGRPLKANGRLVGVNEKKIVEAAETVANRIRPALPQ
jgi:5-methylthioadenosine/S-adenosylhomocysteine deaminase